MLKRAATLRVHIFIGIVLIAFGFIGQRLFTLAYRDHDRYAKTAAVQTERAASVLARGSIYLTDKNENTHLAATNKKFPLAYIVPARISIKESPDIAQKLGGIIGVPPSEIVQAITTRRDAVRIIGLRLTSEQAADVERMNHRGVHITYETDRFYPTDTLAADVLGFLGYDENSRRGQYGVESSYEPQLSGVRSADIVERIGVWDLFARFWSGTEQKDAATVEPGDIVLTIDKNVQTFIEEILDTTLKGLQSSNGSIIVQDPTTGKIIAMADRPSFNPNTYRDASTEAFLNSNVQAIFEPGSSFKPITMAAGLDSKKITPTTTYYDPGVVEVSGFPIKNYDGQAHGTNTMTQVLEKSLNTGTMFVENLVGDEKFRDYIINMGFGQRTNIDLPGEINGDITNLYSGRKINHLTASFGQGIAVTPLQLITAYSAIANGGKLMRPSIVENVLQKNGDRVTTQPEVVGIPMSEKTAYQLQSMLISVVDKGFDKARIKGYDVAGKTGTAQIPDSKGGYLEDEFIHNFLGFVPGHGARFVVMIKVDRPKGVTFAADSLSPVFREVSQFLINYYNIAPTRK